MRVGAGYVRDMRSGLLSFLSLSLCVPLVAQTTSVLRGTVVDATTNGAIAGAEVRVLVGDSLHVATTDEQGAYQFGAIPTGVHALDVAHARYASTAPLEVWVRAGRTETVDVELHTIGRELGGLEVEADAPRRTAPLGTHLLTVEQTLRYPATFFDPARLATTAPGVASANDQANHLSVRGNGPASTAYLLEGAEIVTPNHLTNAGTASDLPTLTGGGTTILSAQMLGTSRLLTGGFGASYGNALGGIMDMRLRRGATDRQAYTLQAGLLGIDLSTEGPFKREGRSSYVVNYRYSTLGLLSSMGVDLGDEAIDFQDLSFHVSVPFDRGSLSIFGMGGISSNRFSALEDTAQWEFDKDSQNIDYTASMGAAGASFHWRLGENSVWHTTAVLSANDQERSANGLYYGSLAVETSARLLERKASVVSQVRGTAGARTAWAIGASAMERNVLKELDQATDDHTTWLLRPFAHVEHDLSEKLHVEVGMAVAACTFSSVFVPEPRALLVWRPGRNNALSLATGQRSQLPQVQNFIGSLFGSFMPPIGPTRMQEVVLAYDQPLGPQLVLHAEVYHQQLQDVPVAGSITALNGFSMVNQWDEVGLLVLQPTGTGANTGVELGVQRRMHHGLFYAMNATWLDATFTDVVEERYNARWNTTGMGNLIVGKEFAKQKETMKRTWGVNGRVAVMGGQRYTPLNTVGTGSIEPWSAQYDTYQRIDLRVYLKREHTSRTGMWALDLLNVAGAQNVGYIYFDRRKNEVVTKYQLGLIPNLSYRIEF